MKSSPAQLIALCGVLVFSLGAHAAEPQAKPPNILLIVAEDMSSRVGAFGDIVANTPTIDALAQQGIRYTHMYSAAGVCAPNRSALITGVYPQSMGTHQMRTSGKQYLAVPPPAVKAFPELLRAAGYATANTAKTDYQFGEPFSIWDVNLSDFAAPPDLALWRLLPSDKPFFAMINLMSTHESRLATPSTKGHGRFAKMVELIAASRAKNVAAVTLPDQVVVPPYYPDTPAVRASIAQHYDNIHFMDQQVAQILGNLEADGLDSNTIVIWTTDHGDGLPRAKRSIYDSGLHVPLIIKHPNTKDAGRLDTRLISAVDLAPMVLNLAGVDIPAYIQGRNVLATDTTPREYIHAGRDRMDAVPDWVRAVRDKRFKYIRNNMPNVAYFRPLTFRDMFPIMQALWQGAKTDELSQTQQFYFTHPRPTEELYDTLADPFEIHNLADNPEYAHDLSRLRKEMARWLAEVGDESSRPESEMIERMWPGRQQPTTAAPLATVNTNMVSLTSATPGASIGYRVTKAENAGPWQLYVGPIKIEQDSSIEAKAIRYGYAESSVARVSLSASP